ncbi:MAG: hypothetical protein K8I29_19575 [Alphaproteobacteria bacterium]|uniref:Uncharacterized protein n=1 Tax=Candidatus Nitrobium versatile TaxID=2884831 RepID=A0A953M3Q7_9BACT|nr:hypothetical protein [Candidatus Nitrobium versatile]
MATAKEELIKEIKDTGDKHTLRLAGKLIELEITACHRLLETCEVHEVPAYQGEIRACRHLLKALGSA